MKVRVAVLLMFALLLGCVMGAHSASAVDLNAELSSKGNPESPSFKYQETVFLNYPDGGKLRDILHGKNVTISFTTGSENPSVQNLINKINANLLHDLKSPTRVTGLTVSYIASLEGSSDSATIDYKLVLVPTIANYVLTRGSDNQTILDAGWMGLGLQGPVVINTTQYGPVDINMPASLLQKITPDAYQQIVGTQAEQILNYPLIDSGQILQHSVNDWQHLFDPAYTISETSDWGYKGTKVPITTYSVGESSVGQDLHTTEHDVTLSLDKEYQIQTIQHASSATVQVDGIAQLEMVGGQLAFQTAPTSDKQPPSTSSGLSIQVIYGMAGFGGAIAVGIFVWSNKKMKETVSLVDTGPLKYETRTHWADKFDSVKYKEEQKTTRSPI